MECDTENGFTPPKNAATARWLGSAPQHRFAICGVIGVRHIRFHIGLINADQIVYLVETDEHLLIFDDHGTEIMTYRRPKLGTKYVSSGRPKGRRPKTTPPSPMS